MGDIKIIDFLKKLFNKIIEFIRNTPPKTPLGDLGEQIQDVLLIYDELKGRDEFNIESEIVRKAIKPLADNVLELVTSTSKGKVNDNEYEISNEQIQLGFRTETTFLIEQHNDLQEVGNNETNFENKVISETEDVDDETLLHC